MPSSLQGKNDSPNRRVSAQEPVVVPDCAPESDDSPTVISKTQPTIEPTSSYKNKITNLGRPHTSPEEMVAGLRGRKLAHFELIEPIGVGGMAAVIRSRDTQLDRFVALKILPPEMAQEQENIERFHQEARAAAKLDHENIARVFYCGEDQGLFFIAFEFVEGDNLRTIMERRGQLPVAEAIRYVLQVAAGLEHAATRGVVHRDVKPSNIIITPTGRAKLVDMGLARNLERRGERDLTQSGMTLGTFDYISPEQALEPREADTRSDIYSLGCTLYHMLTGHPPVPDGTPAKKLQHHQHHFPIDPRHFAPGVPAELVMILSKMMEKDPRNRYHRPIQLVHDLMLVAKKVGAAHDLPNGVLLADMPLPSEPRGRPMLVVGMALAALVAITLLLTLGPGSARRDIKNQVSVPEKGPNNVAAVASDPGNKVNKSSNGGELPATPAVIKKESDFPLVLKGTLGNDKTSFTIVDDVKLETGVTINGDANRRFKFRTDAADENGLTFHYQSAGPPFGLLIEGGQEVEFFRVRFKIDSASTPLQAVAAVALRGVKKATFRECVFLQPNVPKMTSPRKGSRQVPVASLLIDTPEDADFQPEINLHECYFEGTDKTGGQVAIAINGAAAVNLTNCAFKPHAALLQFRKDCSKEKTVVKIQHSAAYVVNGPAFRFNLNASAQIFAKQNVFSRPEGSPLPAQGLPFQNLIYMTDSLSPVKYLGEENLYHNLNGYVGSSDKFIPDKEEFSKFLAKNNGKDQGSKETSVSPWNVKNAVEQPDETAFQLSAQYQDKFGLARTWRGEPMPRLDIVRDPAPPAPQPKIKIVDADDQGKTAGVFGKLAGAIGEAKDGDVILLKHGADREVVMPHVDLRPGVSITLKPYSDDYRPILVLDKAFRDKDTTLFKVQDSKLAIEQLEIRLDPQGIDTGSQAMFLMGETAHCRFDKCVFTLHAANDVKLSVVSFVDLNSMMKMETPIFSSARIEFSECFVRGAGDLVALNGCRVVHVEMKNSLVALDGSLLEVQAGAKAMPMNQGVRWKMERSSIYTTDSLFALHSKGGKGLTKTQADIDGCLLWSLAPEKSIAFHDMTDKIDEQLSTYLEWRGEQNFYANFDGEKIRDWKDQFREMRSEYNKLRFAETKDDMIPKLWDATPEWFRPAVVDVERLSGFGVPADVEKRLLPSLEE